MSQLDLSSVPPPLPLPPLSTPSLGSLFPDDPSLTDRSLELSAIGHEHPGQSLLGPSVAHKGPSSYSTVLTPGGAGGTLTRRVRSAYSEPGLSLSERHGGSRPSTSAASVTSMRSVQPQAISRSFQVYEQIPLFGVASEQTQYRVEYNNLEQSWHKVLFPSLSPSSEKDVTLLEEWMNQQLMPFSQKGGTQGMSMTDVGFCLQVYNVGLNEVYRQTAMQSRRRARVLDGVWRGYVELLEHTRAADGGAVRQEMEVMQREMAANQRQTDLAAARAEQEIARYAELKSRYDELLIEFEESQKAASGSAVKLDIQSFANSRQRRMIGRESRLREKAAKGAIRDQNTALQKEVETEGWREKFFRRDQQGFELETQVHSLKADLEEAGIVRQQLERKIARQAEEVAQAEADVEHLTTERSDLKEEIGRLKEALRDARTQVEQRTKSQEDAERNLTVKVEEASALDARVQTLSLMNNENAEEIRTLKAGLEEATGRAEMYKQSLEEQEAGMMRQIHDLEAQLADVQNSRASLAAEVKRLSEALLLERERSMVKMSGWMEDNFQDEMDQIDRTQEGLDADDGGLGVGEGARVAIVARPQELVDEMEKLLAAAIAEKVKLQKQVADNAEKTRLRIMKLEQDATERETRAQALFASQRKQLDEEKAKSREMHAQLTHMVEEKERMQAETAALKQQARQDAQADLPASERQLEDIRHELAQSKQAQLAAEDRLAQLERTAKALELERNQMEISSSNQAVAAEAALERSKDRERALQAQLDVLKTS